MPAPVDTPVFSDSGSEYSIATGPGGRGGPQRSSSVASNSSYGGGKSYVEADKYYGSSHQMRIKTRTFSFVSFPFFPAIEYVSKTQSITPGPGNRQRRLSQDERGTKPRKFLIDLEETMKIVLEQEDTDGNFQISVDDKGPKIFPLGTAHSNGFKSFDIRGTYMLSNLLQELALAQSYNRRRIVLDESRLTENPVNRLNRMIKNAFWSGLTRRIDSHGLKQILLDPKNRSPDLTSYIYVPSHPECSDMREYYRNLAVKDPSLNLKVIELPPPDQIDGKLTYSFNSKPGILALAMRREHEREEETLEKEEIEEYIRMHGKRPDIREPKDRGELTGIPFVVPGARFNELYNWDSYFISLGLLVDDKVELARGICEHFAFQVKHYGKILNGNRSYYLCRSQPPFLTDFAVQIWARLPKTLSTKSFLRRAIKAAIKEYHTVWMALPRLDPVSGLSRFRPGGQGIPPETEASHFLHILEPYAEKHGLSVHEFTEAYNEGVIKEPELDEYFLHDRAVRESGHDTTYRFEKVCANLGTVDLNSLLYKYEIDIASAIKSVFDDRLELDDEFDLSPYPFGSEVPDHVDRREKSTFASYVPSQSPWFSNKEGRERMPKISSTAKVQTSAEWLARAMRRRKLMDRYMWHEGKAMYFDYDTVKRKMGLYESVTCFWPMWAGCASEHQAQQLMSKALKKFEVTGGLVSGTKESVGKIGLDKPNRQWDYPCAWAPHQIMGWIGMERYGYNADAERLAYRWCYMLTAGFVDFNGVVPEKLDAVALSHHVTAEYGNQGVDFKRINLTGFGWTNASYQIGLEFLQVAQKRAIGNLIAPDVFYNMEGRRRDRNQVEDWRAKVHMGANGGESELERERMEREEVEEKWEMVRDGRTRKLSAVAGSPGAPSEFGKKLVQEASQTSP
ncbi:glycoside hydrolase family 37 protein [Atractiella rhizophila]|nr:glycoside hydrolase family 37 protein [Atractiella rhizophila]